MTDDLRRSILEALERREVHRAILAARALLAKTPGISQSAFIRRAFGRVPVDVLGFKTIRLALLSSFSIEFIQDPLIAQGFLNELHVEIYQPGFAQYSQEILTPSSELYAWRPDVVAIALEGKHLFPFAYRLYLDHFGTGFDDLLDEAGHQIEALLGTFRKQSDATLLVHNFAPPPWRQLGILDGHVGLGQGQALQALNDALYRTVRALHGAYVVDYASLVSRVGAEQWYDERMDHYAQAPLSPTALHLLSVEYMKFLRALAGKSRKCLVLDLDNTLWGGVLGEVGVQGIELGPQYPGSAFAAFQNAVVNLSQRGVLVTIASKNNEGDVKEVFATHPHMVLKPEHFAHTEIHWGSKHRSLEAIARKLNIGLEHMVFVDDSPVECELIRTTLPMVTVIQLPSRPERYVRALLEEGLFDGLTYSEEDAQRSELYHQRAQAEEMLARSDSLDDFLRSLAMEVIFAPVDQHSLSRTAQLTQKTNQFNTTTRRYTEADVIQRSGNPAWIAVTVRVRDRFGDNGIVGVMLAQHDNDALDIDSFLLSCRVIGRKVETAMLAFLCDEAKARGLHRLRGKIIPTKKNSPACDVYERHGFLRISPVDTSETTWQLDLTDQRIECPDCFVVTTAAAVQPA